MATAAPARNTATITARTIDCRRPERSGGASGSGPSSAGAFAAAGRVEVVSNTSSADAVGSDALAAYPAVGVGGTVPGVPRVNRIPHRGQVRTTPTGTLDGS